MFREVLHNMLNHNNYFTKCIPIVKACGRASPMFYCARLGEVHLRGAEGLHGVRGIEK